jgi:hypothetical protein
MSGVSPSAEVGAPSEEGVVKIMSSVSDGNGDDGGHLTEVEGSSIASTDISSFSISSRRVAESAGRKSGTTVFSTDFGSNKGAESGIS